MRILIICFVLTAFSSCLVGRGKLNRMIGQPEEYAILKMYRLPDQTTTYGGYKILIWADEFRSPWVNKWRYTTIWIDRKGIVYAWQAKDEPIPPNLITLDILIRR
jgi:hypothetical protein